jgi:hypothetical protein
VKPDGRRVPQDQKKLKRLALERGWLIASEWPLNEGWKQYYARKSREGHPDIPRDDACLIAEARSRGIKAPSALNDPWRDHLYREIGIDVVLKRSEKRPTAGRPKRSWNKVQANPKDPKVLAKRRRRQAKAAAKTRY